MLPSEFQISYDDDWSISDTNSVVRWQKFPSCQCTVEDLEKVTLTGHQNTADCWQEDRSCSRRRQECFSAPSSKFLYQGLNKSREPSRRGDQICTISSNSIVGPHDWTCFFSPFWRLEIWSVSWMFGKCAYPWFIDWLFAWHCLGDWIREKTLNTGRNIYMYVRGRAVAQWLRHYATNRQVAGSIPDGIIGIFQWQSFRSHYGSNRNEYQLYFLGVKETGA
jgi:hypothetical protein